ncbi:MAG: TetR/AcrR family transcriptional regulator [Deltaproteobacteria bacterium]|nr:TetR/AcrR family transcriptional regulator [Deltaproteobacteria bacterium]
MNKHETELTVLDQIASSDKVRRKIIDAASALYAKKGFTETSIQEISEKSGVSLPVAYHYVKKKTEIMRMIMEDCLNLFQDSLTRQIKDIDDLVERLAIAIKIYFKVVDRQREKVLLIYQQSGSLDRVCRSKVKQLEVDVSNIFEKIIEEGIAQGVFKKVDTDLMAYNIIMIAHMWILKRWHFKHRIDLDKYTDLQVKIIMDALKK